MKSTVTLFCFITSLLTTITLYAQDPNIIWQKTLGGLNQDILFDIEETHNGEFILVGNSGSDVSGNKTAPSNGAADIWVLKVNVDGNVQWQNSIGGFLGDDAHSMVSSDDGGYILVGESNSDISGDKSEDSRGGYDYWIVKMNSSGSVEWDKTYGGSGFEYAPKIVKSVSGGFFICGQSNSDISGDKTENSIGSSDLWVLKFDESGNLLWQDTIGGVQNEGYPTLAATLDGGCILGSGSSSNISGDKTENSKGGYDYWIVKLDASGTKEWDKTIGGNLHDNLHSIFQTNDGGYLLGGGSLSGISGDKTEPSIGDWDYWLVKTDSDGSIQWQNTIGGENNDKLTSLFQTYDGGFILGGNSLSNTSGDKTEDSKGEDDFWVLKVNNVGVIEWQNTIGGSDIESLTTIIQSSDGSFIIGGSSFSNSSADKTEDSFGMEDYWILKLNSTLGVIDNELSNSLTLYPNPAKNILEINADNQQIDRVKIFSVKGDLVQQVESFETSKTIDVSQLASGMYYVQFTAGKQIATKKFIKQ